MPTFYVSNSGNDSNPGTFALPWETINYAVSNLSGVVSGDDIIIQDGIYNEYVAVEVAGLIITAATANQAILDGTGLTLGVLLPESNQTVTGQNPNGTSSTFTSGPVTEDALLSFDTGVLDVSISGIKVTNSPGYGVKLNGNNDISLLNMDISSNANSGIISHSGSANTVIDNVEVYENSNYAQFSRSYNLLKWFPAILFDSSTNGLIENSIIRNNWSEAVSISNNSDAINISDNNLFDNYSSNLLIDGNTLADISGNTVYHSLETTYNIFGEHGPEIIINFDEGISSTSDINLFNNLIVAQTVGIVLGNNNGVAREITDSIRIYNNTVVSQESALHTIGNVENFYTNSFVNDNVFYSPSNAYTTSTSVTNSTTGQLEFESNSWYGGNIPSGIVSVTDVNQDPLLLNPNSVVSTGGSLVPNNYKLTSGSPLIGQSQGATTSSSDYFGTDRTANIVQDIGFHEFSTTGNTAPTVSISPQVNTVGDGINYTPVYTEIDTGDTLVYNASGLPDGITIDANTGIISGSPTISGNYTYTVFITDGIDTGSDTSMWVIADSDTSSTVVYCLDLTK